MPTHYEVLGCDRSASYEELKKCYQERAKKFHPDRSGRESEVEFDLLDKAWKTLRDADARRQYDLDIGKNDLDETPLYCEVSLSEMTREPEMRAYSHVCRCGGMYILTENDARGCEKVKVPCDECSFHISVALNK